MKAGSLHHVQIALPAEGEPAGRRYFGDIFGLTENPKPANLQGREGVWFETGNAHLHLGVDPSFTPATRAHVALQYAELGAVRARLSASGYPIVDDEPLPGYERFSTSDPFGNRFERVSPSAK